MVLPGFRKLSGDQMGSRPPNSDHLFLMKIWLWEVLWSFSVQQLSWLSPVVIKSSFRRTSQSDREMVHCTVREDNISKQWFFWFAVSSWGTHLSTFLTFPICFKCQMTVEWSTSTVVFTGSAFMTALNWSLLTSNGQPLCSSSRLLSPLQNFLEAPLHCTLASSSWAKCYCWCCKLFSTTLWLILNSNKKSLKFAFCLASFL